MQQEDEMNQLHSDYLIKTARLLCQHIKQFSDDIGFDIKEELIKRSSSFNEILRLTDRFKELDKYTK